MRVVELVVPVQHGGPTRLMLLVLPEHGLDLRIDSDYGQRQSLGHASCFVESILPSDEAFLLAEKELHVFVVVTLPVAHT